MAAFAFVFPGQGSQSVGMLDAWGDDPEVRAVVEEASGALDQDLGRLMYEGPTEQLALTTNTQPLMLTAGIACWRAWLRDGGAQPQALAGHSLGEYSALVAAGVIALADAVRLVRLRAQAMQDAVPVGTGAMAAVLGMEADRVASVCSAVTSELAAAGGGELVQAVNFNTPVQTVIAGTQAAVDVACGRLKEAGAKRALVLPVSAPFHSSLMRPAAEKLRDALGAVPFTPPSIPVINNVDVTVESDPARIRDALYRQAFNPVRWVETVQKFKTTGVQAVVECGPGKVLSGMTARIDGSLASAALYDPATLAEVRTLVQDTHGG